MWLYLRQDNARGKTTCKQFAGQVVGQTIRRITLKQGSDPLISYVGSSSFGDISMTSVGLLGNVSEDVLCNLIVLILI